MNDFIIQKYVDSVSLNNIMEYAKKEEIFLTQEEANTLLYYLKKFWKDFYYGYPDNLINEIKNKISETNYQKLITLYNEAKEKIKNNS